MQNIQDALDFVKEVSMAYLCIVNNIDQRDAFKNINQAVGQSKNTVIPDLESKIGRENVVANKIEEFPFSRITIDNKSKDVSSKFVSNDHWLFSEKKKKVADLEPLYLKRQPFSFKRRDEEVQAVSKDRNRGSRYNRVPVKINSRNVHEILLKDEIQQPNKHKQVENKKEDLFRHNLVEKMYNRQLSSYHNKIKLLRQKTKPRGFRPSKQYRKVDLRTFVANKHKKGGNKVDRLSNREIRNILTKESVTITNEIKKIKKNLESYTYTDTSYKNKNNINTLHKLIKDKLF